MTTPTPQTTMPPGRRARIKRAGLLVAAGAPALVVTAALAPSAAAETTPTPADSLSQGISGLSDGFADLAGDLAGALPDSPLLPDVPAPVLPTGSALPVNLLRRDTPGAETLTTELVDQVTSAAGPDPYTSPGAATGAATKADTATTSPAAPRVDAFQVARAHIASDPSVIGQWVGAFKPPAPELVNDALTGVNTLINRGVGGAIADVQSAIDTTLASPEYQAWANNDANPFAYREGAGVERAAAGISALIDSITARPAETLTQILVEAGGPARVLTDPIGAARDVVTKIAGVDFARDVTEFLTVQLGPSIAEALRAAAPAALIPLLLAIPGALAGAATGIVPGALLGGILGALNPLSILAGLATAIPGGVLGGLATGALGLLGSALATLPLLLGLPLLGAAGASALALAAAATIIFGTWLASVGVAALVLAGIGIVAGVIVAIVGSIVAPPLFLAAIGGGILTFLFILAIGTGAYMALTIALPVIIFGLVAIPLLLGAGLLGAAAGLLAGLAIAAIAIPLITALSAIPGAILGSILGYLAGSLATKIISALIGAGIGALLGALLGGLVGAGLGALLGVPVALAVAAFLALTRFNDLASSFGDGALGRLAEAIQRGWNDSALKKLLDRLTDELGSTTTGEALNKIGALITATLAQTAFLDGRRLREMIIAAALRGAIPGGLAGAGLGGLLGALAGLLNPTNLLAGIPGGILGALLGIPAGALAGAGLSALIGALTTAVVTPLAFLPILAALTALWAIPAILSSLVALAAAILPPIALGVAAGVVGGLLVTSPLWIPLTILAVTATIVTFVAFAITFWSAITGVGLPIAAVAGTVATIAGIAAVVLATANFLVIGGGILGGLALIGIPVFLMTLPLFIFPALAIPLLNLLALPLVIPVAAGLSLLAGLAAGTLTGLGSLPLTVPLGAILGGLTGATLGAVTAIVARAIARAVTDGILGAVLGGILGAGVGATLSVLYELISSTRVTTFTDSGAFGIDARLINTNAAPHPKAANTQVAVPTPAAADFGFEATPPAPRRAVDITDLIAA